MLDLSGMGPGTDVCEQCVQPDKDNNTYDDGEETVGVRRVNNSSHIMQSSGQSVDQEHR